LYSKVDKPIGRLADNKAMKAVGKNIIRQRKIRYRQVRV
jgi:hypothetical protein